MLAICQLGGIGLIESKCGLDFSPRAEHPNCNPPMKLLLSIRRELIKQQSESMLEAARLVGQIPERDYLVKTDRAFCITTVLPPETETETGREPETGRS
jgi:hypothetical protein